MKLLRTVLAGAMFTAIGSAALAQDDRTGTVTVLDRVSGSVTIRQEQNGGAGNNSGGAVERFNAPVKLLENVHAGDKVTFSTTGTDSAKTITKIETQ